ncbi:MAG TPA: serine/threonine protein kinase, partial [Myxococcales bacterium]|nr:serine/threonine protein kinase [Myxococcales bacterium]
PANIFLCALPTDPHHVKLLDFGFVKLVADEGESPQSVLTQSGIAFGTPSYMSPEQATGDVVDARADLYAFGVVLFEM